jgi:transcriptional regulator with XRE-family HTH domain
MAGIKNGNPATHFGRQMKKERLARGWSLRELAGRTGVNEGHLSRIETGKRPPTEYLATECDRVFPERKGWFTEYYAELSTWSEVPAAFKDWTDFENKAAALRDWWPSVVSGLLQTEDYAAALLRTYPGVSGETVSARLASRMERQRRLFARDAMMWFVVDEMALYRLTGGAVIMAAQMRRLSEVAGMPNVTMQVLPAVANPGMTGGFILADESAYAEHAASGFVYTLGETVSALARIFDSLRGECYRVSESAAMIERVAGAWTGGHPVFQAQTEGRA